MLSMVSERDGLTIVFSDIICTRTDRSDFLFGVGIDFLFCVIGCILNV